jgi:pilus assembly protein CpaF
MTTNFKLTLVVILVGVIGLTVWYLRSKREKVEVKQDNALNFDRLVDIVKYTLGDLIKDENFGGLTDEEFQELYKRKARIQDAMRNCVYGIDSAKFIVQDLIKKILIEKLPDEESVCQVLDFQSPSIETRIKFEIIMYFYKKKYGKAALSKMIEDYRLDRERYIIEGKKRPSYAITVEDIDMIFEEQNYTIDYPIMIDILAVLVYQKYKGFGILDTIREMDINGFNCGTSGSVLSALRTNKKVMEAPRSVWLYFRGIYIHMRFLTFNTEAELRRTIQLICRYNNPGPLTEKKGYLVNTMFDKSRVLAMRPPVSEYWAVFVRKFTLNDSTLTSLIAKEYVSNSEIVIRLIEYLMMGQVTAGVTGRQGSGKTTLMTAMIEAIDPRYTIRVLEMAPEMYLRELYPERNILSAQETEFVSAAKIQDAFKKSDGAVSIVGEVATDDVAARMIQMGQIASLFTIFSHHANRTVDLVRGIRNSLVNAGGFTSMVTAEQQVIDVIKVDIHLDYTTTGKRYVDRITEIIPLDEGIPYPEYDPTNHDASMAALQKEYYTRRTDRQTFTTRDILKYDLENDSYETVEWFTPTLTNYILNCLPESKRAEFVSYVEKYWEV